MPDFQYPQFCSLARATEIIGERWNLLILRQLALGPRRFSDLRRQLSGVSPSILSERLGSLESHDIIKRTEIERPVPGVVYELDEAGIDLIPVLRSLARWGTRFLLPLRPGDRLDPELFYWFLESNSMIAGGPAVSIELRMTYEGREHCFHIEAGEHPTKLSDKSGDADVVVSGDSIVVAGVATGVLDPTESAESGLVTIEGEVGALARFSDCFDLGLPLPSSMGPPG